MELELDKEAENDIELRYALNTQDAFKNYYQSGFPFFQIYKWLSYAKMNEKGKILDHNKDYFKRREISYEKSTDDGKEQFVIRHLCFDNHLSFQKSVRFMNPIRIDIGPVCDQTPDNNKNQFGTKAVAEEREYVIDIDMNDYDTVRTCCSGAKMCSSCWKYIKAAHLVLKAALEKDFGFQHILWVFSGRRGVHAWICDERARKMDNTVRSGVTDYLSLAIANEKSDRLVKEQVIDVLGKDGVADYTLFQRSFKILKPLFEDFMVKEQAYFWYDKNIEKIFEILTRIIKSSNGKNDDPKGFNLSQLQELKDQVMKETSGGLAGFPVKSTTPNRVVKSVTSEHESNISQSRWDRITVFLKKKGQDLTWAKFEREVVIGLMYPKLDAHVSAQTNHLLKCPFNVHKATGRISVPILDFDTFEMKHVPHVIQVNDCPPPKGDEKNELLKPWLDIFEGFCSKLYKQEILVAAEMNGGQMEEEGIAF